MSVMSQVILLKVLVAIIFKKVCSFTELVEVLFRKLKVMLIFVLTVNIGVKNDFDKVIKQIEQVSRLLNGLIASAKKQKSTY